MDLRAALLSTVLAGAIVAGAAAPAGATSDPVVAYQENVRHDGHVHDPSLRPPFRPAWTVRMWHPSYPVIAGGRVFVTSVGRGVDYGKSKLWAIDANTGAVLWNELVGLSPWSAITYDAGTVFAVDNGGTLSALDAASGSQLWSEQLPGQYSFSSPPTAQGGVVYVGGSGSGGTLYAVDESDGSVSWSQPVVNGDDSSPALSDTSVFVSYACFYVQAFEKVLGDPEWTFQTGCSGGGGTTAAYHGGSLFVRDSSQGRILDAVSGARTGFFRSNTVPAFIRGTMVTLRAGTLAAIDVSARDVLWRKTLPAGAVTAPITINRWIVEGTADGQVMLLRLSDGRVVWRGSVPAIIDPPDERNVSQPLTGLGAGRGILVVPADDRVTAFAPAR